MFRRKEKEKAFALSPRRGKLVSKIIVRIVPRLRLFCLFHALHGEERFVHGGLAIPVEVERAAKEIVKNIA